MMKKTEAKKSGGGDDGPSEQKKQKIEQTETEYEEKVISSARMICRQQDSFGLSNSFICEILDKDSK